MAAADEALEFVAFFGPVVEAEGDEERAAAVQRVAGALSAAAAAAEGRIAPEGRLLAAEDAEAAARLGGRLVEAHLGSVHVLAAECPLPAVREAMARLAASLQARGWPGPPAASLGGPSAFVAEARLTPPTPPDAERRELFEDLFVSAGRLTHVDRVLGWHPSFLAAHARTLAFVMRDDGPLPAAWRHYLAVLAASRYACAYLVDAQCKEFAMSDGDPEWLRGLDRAPRKLQNIARLNALLAHQPWLLTADHVRDLVGPDAQASGDAWSHAELVQAMVILTTFHSLCGLVYGLGVRPERDFGGGSGAAAAAAGADGVRPLMERLSLTPQQREKLLSTQHGGGGGRDNAFATAGEGAGGDEAKEDGGAEAALAAEAEAEAEAEAAARAKAAKAEAAKAEAAKAAAAEAALSPSRFLDPRGRAETALGRLKYENFDVHSTSYNIFQSHDYSWKEHGYLLVERFYRGLAPLLDAELDLIYNLTYQSFNTHKNVDTAPFRRAVWYYAHRLYGVCYDDYDYREINTYLDIEVKVFVKKICCHPQTVTAADFDGCGDSFLPEEKCHIALLALEGHRLSSLLYGLRALLQARQGT